MNQVEINNLSPGSNYTFRFNVQMGPMSGPSVHKQVKTYGNPLPKPEITEAKLVPTSGTTIKLSWKLPDDAKKDGWIYAIYYGMKMTEIISEGPRFNTTPGVTTFKVPKLHACESYTFVVAIVGPKGFGPPSNPVSTSTKFAAGAPPKNLQATVDPSNNNIKLTWDASCSVIDQPIGYFLTSKDLTTNKSANIKYTRTVNTRLDKEISNVQFGTRIEFTVATDVQNAQSSNVVTVKSVDLPTPEALVSFPNLNTSQHEIRWQVPKKMPKYPQKQQKDHKLSYRLMISSDGDFKKPELTYNNLTTTKFQLPMEKLETGKMYYVGVSLVDNGKYVSSPAGPIILETPVPAKDMIVSPSGVAGVLVPIFIVIAILGSALGYYMYRNRRLKRNFIAFASRYSPATGAAILNAASLDDDDDDSPIIRGFADDEPLVVS